MGNPINFDGGSLDLSNDYEPLPAGTYTAEVESGELTPTKAGTGYYIKFKFKVIEGQFAGRTVFQNININNQNKQAEEIGQKQLGRLCKACTGQPRLKTDSDLNGLALKVKLKIRQDKTGQYDDSNEVSDYLPLDGQRPPMASPPQAEAAPWA